MSGIDKIELKTDREDISLQSLLRRLRNTNILYINSYLASEQKHVIMFPKYEGCFIKYNGRYYREGADYNNYITHINLNPSRLDNARTLNTFFDCIGRDILAHFFTNRIDFCVDYRLPISDVLASADIRAIQSTKAYIETNGGHIETLAVGKEPDVLLIYDKFREANRRRNRENPYTNPYTRIERQIRTRDRIMELLGYQIDFDDIESFIDDVRAGLFDPFSDRVELSQFIPNMSNTLTERQVERRGALMTLSRVNSYGVARRILDAECNGNFSRQYQSVHTRTPYHEIEQPITILRKALTSFFGIRPRIPTRIINNGTSTEPRGIYR